MSQTQKKRKIDHVVPVKEKKEENILRYGICFVFYEYAKYNPTNPNLKFFSGIVSEFMVYEAKRKRWAPKNYDWKGDELIARIPLFVKKPHEHVEIVLLLEVISKTKKLYFEIAISLKKKLEDGNSYLLSNGEKPKQALRLQAANHHEQQLANEKSELDRVLHDLKSDTRKLFATAFYRKACLSFLKTIFVWQTNDEDRKLPDDIIRSIIDYIVYLE